MSAPLVALAGQPTDVMGQFSAGQRQALGAGAAKREEFEKFLQIVGSASMYALGGNPNGQADPAKYSEVMDGLTKMGMQIPDDMRNNPSFANVAANATTDALKQLQLAQTQQQLELAIRKFEQDLTTGPKRSLQPVYTTDANGKPVIVQLGDDGTAATTKMPEGLTPSTGIEKTDVGTHYVLTDKRSGQVVGTLPKDVAGEAAETEIGKARGKAQTELGGTLQKADQSIALIDQMLTHPGRATGTGLSSTLDPRNYIAGTDATNFGVMVQQLQGKAFLEAFESLKGGGQITEVEGQKATQAIARLSTAQSDEAFVEALNELKGILELGKARATERAGQSGTAPASTPAGASSAQGEVTSQDQYDALPSGAEFTSGGKRYRKP